jgi:hypothetical protein
MNRADIYQQVVAVIQEYLGPAADRYVQRLVEAHLKKSPEQLAQRDIPKLSEWIKVSLGLLTNDKNLVDECEKRILKLARA